MFISMCRPAGALAHGVSAPLYTFRPSGASKG